MAFLEWLENTWLSTTLRDSPNIFLYPTILAFHTLGLAFLVGISSAISLRILGVARSLPLAPLRKFFPIMWLGFAANALSGVLLLLIEPTRFLTMLDFYVKLVVIAAAVTCVQKLYTRQFRDSVRARPLGTTDRALATSILVLWGAAITAGRMTAYDSPSAQWQTAIATLAVTIVGLVVGYVAVRLFGWIRSALPGHTDVAAPHHEAVSR